MSIHKMETKDFRGISSTYKVLFKILHLRLKKTIKIIGNHKAGFPRGRSTADQIFVLLKEAITIY